MDFQQFKGRILVEFNEFKTKFLHEVNLFKDNISITAPKKRRKPGTLI